MRLPYKTGLEFELSVVDIVSALNPIDSKDLEELSDGLHEAIESAMYDFIENKEAFQDYEEQY